MNILDKTGLTYVFTKMKAFVAESLTAKADNTHSHGAGDITSGTISADRLPTVPLSKGGTGATTADAAITNLGITAMTTAEIDAAIASA